MLMIKRLIYFIYYRVYKPIFFFIKNIICNVMILSFLRKDVNNSFMDESDF